MLLTISTTHQPAGDLGYLLHKHPDKLQRFPQSFGEALVFYPEASAERCTAALLVDIDPVRLVRGSGRQDGLLDQYVNDRPYAASSLLAVALGDVFRSAINGSCKDRPELVATAMPFRIELPAVPCRGGRRLLEALFAPLGYQIEAEALPFDPAFPDWGNSSCFALALTITATLQTVLSQLYVLLPVLDDGKHYWIGDAEVEKLLRHGGDWLAGHPEKALIARRYLKHQGHLARLAMARLAQDVVEEEAIAAEGDEREEAEANVPLNRRRIDAIQALIEASGARSVLDVGCGDGKLLLELARRSQEGQTLVGLDASSRALEIAAERLDRLAPRQRERVSLLHGSLTYRDARIEGFDLAACVEVIEHLDPPRVAALTRILFGHTRPHRVVLTTPNRDYNALFPDLPAGALRHSDHRFEWSRAEFAAWAGTTAKEHGYAVELSGIGDDHPEFGQPTQMAVFCIDAARTEAA